MHFNLASLTQCTRYRKEAVDLFGAFPHGGQAEMSFERGGGCRLESVSIVGDLQLNFIAPEAEACLDARSVGMMGGVTDRLSPDSE